MIGCALTTVISLLAVLAGYLWYKRSQRSHSHWLSLDGRFVLITGCDSGFGHGLAKRLDSKGLNVFACCLLENGEGAKKLKSFSKRIRVVPLDVTSDESVRKCRQIVDDAAGKTGLWSIVNNAGINILGDVEFYTMEMFKQVSEVNLFGMVRMVKAFIPLLRASKGRILNVTSVKGLVADYHNSAYGLTKFAGEAFSDSLRIEMKRFGVSVVIIEPGNFGASTGMMANPDVHKKNYVAQWAAASDEVKKLYGEEYLEHKFTNTQSVTARPAIDPVVDVMEHAVMTSDPDVRYLISGGDSFFDKYCLFARIKPYMPYGVMDYLVEKFL